MQEVRPFGFNSEIIFIHLTLIILAIFDLEQSLTLKRELSKASIENKTQQKNKIFEKFSVLRSTSSFY